MKEYPWPGGGQWAVYACPLAKEDLVVFKRLFLPFLIFLSLN